MALTQSFIRPFDQSPAVPTLYAVRAFMRAVRVRTRHSLPLTAYRPHGRFGAARVHFSTKESRLVDRIVRAIGGTRHNFNG
jgi:hypothetical protein